MSDTWMFVLFIVVLVPLAISAGLFIAVYIDELRREDERCGRWWR